MLTPRSSTVKPEAADHKTHGDCSELSAAGAADAAGDEATRRAPTAARLGEPPGRSMTRRETTGVDTCRKRTVRRSPASADGVVLVDDGPTSYASISSHVPVGDRRSRQDAATKGPDSTSRNDKRRQGLALM